jgi:hypothetical protein
MVEDSLSKTKKHKRYKRQAQNESTTQEYQDYQDYINFYGTDALQEDTANDKKKGDKINGLPREIHCDLVQTLKTLCAEYSILELWNYDVSVIRNLTREDIINDLNMVKKSPVTGYEADFLKFLGGKKYNLSGSVVGASSLLIIWNTEWDTDKLEDSNKILGIEWDIADPFTMQWESDVINNLLSQTKKMQDNGQGFELYFNLVRR